MSGKSNIPDTDSKCDGSDPTGDSGFLSGSNISEFLDSRQEQPHHSDNSDLLRSQQKDSEMLKEDNVMPCMDSGVGLSESFSSISLKNPDMNDLNSKSLPPVDRQSSEKWEVFYEQDNEGNTHLHLMIAAGMVEYTIALIRLATHPQLLDTPNDNAQTPLHLAVQTGQHVIVRMLVVAGAKPAPRGLHGDSPLHIACRKGDVNCLNALLKPVSVEEKNALNPSYQPIYKSVDIEQWNYFGETCVHVAALKGHVDVLRHLYWYQADINVREGRSGYTALHMAVERKDENMVAFLLRECPKLDVGVRTYGGKSALQLTPIVPDEIRRLLSLRGVSPYASDDDISEDDDDDSYDPIFLPSLVNASA